MTQHRIFKLPMAALVKVLAENGAEEVAPNSHTPLPQSATKKQSRWLTYKELKTLKGISYSRITPQTAGRKRGNFLSGLKAALESTGMSMK